MIPLVLATTNPGKRSEVLALLAGLPVELRTLESWPALSAPDEVGHTFAANARLKAEYYAGATGCLVAVRRSESVRD
jgi:XTP/dITP diphosphohydrolase